LRRIADAAIGTDRELIDHARLARAMKFVQPDAAEAELVRLLAVAESESRLENAAAIAGDLIGLFTHSGRFEEALVLVDRLEAFTREAGFGPWTQLGNEAYRLQLLQNLGRNDEEVLARVEALRTIMAGLPEQGSPDERLAPWNVREGILQTGASAATHLQRWQQALELNAEVAASQHRRNAPALERANTQLGASAPLLRLGRVNEARTMLLNCREVFAAGRSLDQLGRTISGLAEIERSVDRHDSASRLEQDALRLKYASHDPNSIAASHSGLASDLWHAGEHGAALAHRMAAALIDLHMGAGGLTSVLRALARDLSESDEPPVPGSFSELSQMVAEVDGVRLTELVARLPPYPGGEDEALAEIERRARAIPIEEAWNVDRFLEAWTPIVAGIAAAIQGEEDAAAWVEQRLSAADRHSPALTGALRQVMIGEWNENLLEGLNPAERAVIGAIVDELARAHEARPAAD